MLKHAIVLSMICCLITAEPPVQVGVKPTNVIGSPEQHTSFSFVRPGLTQTSFAFAGPSSHQSFAASIGNSQLAQKVQPSIAHALAQRNPGLGYYTFNPAMNGVLANAFSPYQTQAIDPVIPLTYAQQLQQPQQAYLQAYQPNNAIYQSQLSQLLALRLAQAQQGQLHAIPSEQVPVEQSQLQQIQQTEQQSQKLLGTAYSSAPSVARVKVSGNGYKFNF